MPISHYSQFKDGVVVGGVMLSLHSHGRTYYVCNNSVTTPHGKAGSDTNSGKTPDQPLGTLDKAISLCTANRGDTIIVMPGHAETISSATALAFDVAGISIIGVGSGSLRPTFTLDTATTTTIAVSAANVSVHNCIFTANFADIVSFFTLTTAPNFHIKSCYFKATATNMNCLWVVDTDATTGNADGLTIEDSTWIDLDAANISMVKLDGSNSNLKLYNNYVQLGVNNSKPSLITQATGKTITSLDCGHNKIYRLVTTNAGMILTSDSTNTGVIYNNFAQGADGTNNLMASASSGYGFFENRYSGVAGATGFVNPGADS